MIHVYYVSDNMVVIELDGQMLQMEREEAEKLFVDLGHVLQDMDIAYWGDKTGDGTEQPKE